MINFQVEPELYNLEFQFSFSCDFICVWLYPISNFSFSGLFFLSHWLVLTWRGKDTVPQLAGCSFCSGCAGQLWPFPAINDCSLLSLTPHMDCASRCALVCSRSCSLSLPFLSLCLKAEKPHFSCCLPLASDSTAQGRFHRIPLWTAVFNEDLLRIFWTTLYLKLPKFSLYKCFCEHFIAMPKLFSMFCADKEKLFQRKHFMPFWMTSCCFPTIFLFAFFFPFCSIIY